MDQDPLAASLRTVRDPQADRDRRMHSARGTWFLSLRMARDRHRLRMLRDPRREDLRAVRAKPFKNP